MQHFPLIALSPRVNENLGEVPDHFPYDKADECNFPGSSLSARAG